MKHLYIILLLFSPFRSYTQSVQELTEVNKQISFVNMLTNFVNHTNLHLNDTKSFNPCFTMEGFKQTDKFKIAKKEVEKRQNKLPSTLIAKRNQLVEDVLAMDSLYILYIVDLKGTSKIDEVNEVLQKYEQTSADFITHHKEYFEILQKLYPNNTESIPLLNFTKKNIEKCQSIISAVRNKNVRKAKKHYADLEPLEYGSIVRISKNGLNTEFNNKQLATTFSYYYLDNSKTQEYENINRSVEGFATQFLKMMKAGKIDDLETNDQVLSDLINYFSSESVWGDWYLGQSSMNNPIGLYNQFITTSAYPYQLLLVQPLNFKHTQLDHDEFGSANVENVHHPDEYLPTPINTIKSDSDAPINNVEIARRSDEDTQDPIQAIKIDYSDAPINNIVLLLDISRSMRIENRFSLLRTAMSHLVKFMRAQDKITIVTYGEKSNLLFDSVDKSKLINVLAELQPNENQSNVNEGLKLGYKSLLKNYKKDSNNKIILATDGEVVLSKSMIKSILKKHEKQGLTLSIMQFKKSEKLEQLKQLNLGNFHFILSEKDALISLASETKGHLQY